VGEVSGEGEEGSGIKIHYWRVKDDGQLAKAMQDRTVAMQSSGVYWIAVFDILEEAGLEVYLVNARDTKNLLGRKSDVQESQWLMKLHTYGLLRAIPSGPPKKSG
jgi:transposase